MRKWTACILAALCVFGLFGCGAKSVPSLDEVKDCAPADYEERFKGVTREALISSIFSASDQSRTRSSFPAS